MRRLLPAILLALLLGGCGTAVRHSVTDGYAKAAPVKVAVLPVVWEEKAPGEAEDISRLFRAMSVEKLAALKYITVPLEEFEKHGRDAEGWASRPPNEAAALLGADGLLYIRVTDWDRDSFIPYASLSIKAYFELRSATGQLLWTADYRSRESDLNLDRAPMHLAMYKAYEPRVQRFVDAVFTTLPPGKAEERTKTYFKWLP
ncbi:MAG: hypothetical protein QY316_12710 [Thermodesulfobacteriota bacterium]|nr:MAG: hypothetical protein QY316_12710 [Thermodesulfobacteriota bacterium]